MSVERFSDIEGVLFSWPSEVTIDSSDQWFLRSAALIRTEKYSEAESLLLSQLAESSDKSASIAFWLLAYLYCEIFDFKRAKSVLSLPIPSGWSCRLPWSYLHLRCMAGCHLIDSDLPGEISAIDKIFAREDKDLAFAQLADITIKFSSGNLSGLLAQINSFNFQDSIECNRYRSRFYASQNRHDEALLLLKSLVDRCPTNPGLLIHYAEACLDAQSSEDSVPALNRLHSRLGDHIRVLPLILQVKLLQRQPSIALRSALMIRSCGGLKLISRIRHQSNQITSYEMTGRVEWFPYLLDKYRHLSNYVSDVSVSNMIYHLASIESTGSEKLSQQVFSSCKSKNTANTSYTLRGVSFRKASSSLRIGWMTPDISPHPVSRFLHSFLLNSSHLDDVQHYVIDVSPHRDNQLCLTSEFSALRNVEVCRYRSMPCDVRVDKIRDLQCDVLVDLAGWTGGNCQEELLRRLSPVQLNYLGYFASTGNPSIDGWVGDHALFPEPMQEWHTEKIIRLQRCFIAFQPSDRFAEGRLDVSEAPRGGIRFGSFNHNRKLSDQTLRVWGRILQQCPGSSLVLKANAASDPGTQELLRRRMLRQGLNPQQVIWLPLAGDHESHLRQYAEVDVALDCFPNGGCTTTCESLWMGAPVITKTGKSYVSRMSTAVLHGAEIPQFCANSDEHYVQLALQQLDQLSWLRQNRDHWRAQVRRTALGNAGDLMLELCRTFQQLVTP